MRSRTFVLFVLLGLFAAGCASAPRHTAKKPAPGTETGAYDFRSEGTIPQAGADEAAVVADVEEIPLAGDTLDVREAEAPPPDTLKTPAPVDSTADGFRIQVFATADRDVAQGAAGVASERLGLPAYTDLEGGVYKVRVGDYVDRGVAEEALATVRSHYYPDAWIVPARVRVPRGAPAGD